VCLTSTLCNMLIQCRSSNKVSTSTLCLKKNKQNYFCYNYVKLPPNLTISGTMMANCLKLYKVHSFSTSPNLCQCAKCLYRVNRRSSELSQNAVGLIVSVRLLTIASSIRQKAPHDLIIFSLNVNHLNILH